MSREEIIEKSKFLGGDLEHTHLVKGLDYTLRNKVLKELESEEVQLPQAPQPPPQPKPVSSSNTTKHLFTKKALLKLREQENLNEEEEQKKIEEKKEKIVKEEEKEEDESNPTQSKRKPKFKTHIAKSVYYTLFLSSIPESTEAFLPGRTCLIFNLVSKNEPDIIMRSAEKFSPLKVIIFENSIVQWICIYNFILATNCRSP